MLDLEATKKVLEGVLKERDRQDSKWGEQNHNPLEWLSILSEEVGEVALAINIAHFGDVPDWTNYRKELLEVAAVAVAAVEALDRGKAIPGTRGHKWTP